MIKTKIFLVILCIISATYGENYLPKANEYYQNNEYKKAIKTYYLALENDENPALVYFNLGNAYYQIDKPAKAIVCYQTSIEEAPEFFRSYLNLGILYYNLDDMAGAAATLEQACILEPENTQVMLILASVYKNLNEYSLAVPLLEKILEADPKSGDCYFLLYEINRKIGDLTEARTWLEKYPKEGKRTPDTYQLLGELAEETGNLSEAAFYYSQLISIAPERKWIHYQLVRAMYGDGNILTALQQADFALERFENFSELALLAGNISFECKLYRKAEKFYSLAYSSGSAGGLVGLQNLLQLYKTQGDDVSASHINNLIIASK